MINLITTKKTFTRQSFGYCAGTARNTDPVPLYADMYFRRAFGLTRSHDADLTWANIETSPGVYDWSKMDKWVLESTPKHKIWTIEIMPTFYSSIPASVGPYWPPGSNASPKPECWVNFYNYIITGLKRYGDLGINIAYLEIQNEVNFSIGEAKFFNGTKEQLAEMCYWAKKAATDSGVGSKIISPSLTGLSDTYAANDPNKPDVFFTAMMAASDGHGGTMADNIDYVGVHLYGNNLTLNDRCNYAKSFAGTKPVMNTENGIRMTDTLPNGIEMPFMTELELYKQLAKMILIPLAYSIPTCAYALGKLALLGKYSLAGHPKAFEDLNQLIMRVVNGGIDKMDLLDDGTLQVTIRGVLETF